ncbi:MAG: DNA repair protein RecO [Pseudomonadota bacterium]
MIAPGQARGEEGYILHARPWRDTSLLLEVFLREGGRRGVIARGARRNANLRARLQPFRKLWLDLGGRGELAQLRTAEDLLNLPAMNGRTLACAYYLNELLIRLLPRDDAHAGLFEHYAEALTRLAGGRAEAPVLRAFEKALLEELGWAPDWLQDTDDQTIEPEAMYHVHPEHGVQRVSHSSASAVSGISLVDLAEGRFTEPATQREIRLILHALMAPHLGPQPLRSRELLAASARSTPNT